MHPSDTDPAAWRAIGFPHLLTFLALVREGSVTRAAHQLGLGHSTASAHIKLLTDCFGQRFFKRFQGGLTPTRAGLDAYRALVPLIARVQRDLCWEGAPADAAQESPREVLLSATHPGALVERAVLGLEGSCGPGLLPDFQADGGSPTRLRFTHGSGLDPDIATCRDRWVLLRKAGAHCGWAGRQVSLADLAGLLIQAPALPPSLLAALATLADATGARLDTTEAPLGELLARSGENQAFCAIVPASLFNPALATTHFECAPLSASVFDPQLGVLGPADAAATLCAAVAALLCDEAVLRGTTPPPAMVRAERLSLKHIRSFLVLFEEGNVRRAAARLCIVQPALTVQLRRIEEQVGAPLFARLSSGLRALDLAGRLYALWHPLVDEIERVLAVMHAAGSDTGRRVRVGLMPAVDDESLTAEAFAGALDSWTTAQPHRFIQVTEGNSGTLIEWLRAGKVDLVLVDRPVLDPGLAVDRIAEDPMAVVIDRDSGLLPPGPVTLERMARLPLILPSARHGLRILLSQHLQDQELLLRPRMEVDSLATTLSLVKTGRYAAILPISAVHKSTIRRRLSVHEIRVPAILRTTCLVRIAGTPANPDVLSLVDALRHAFSANDRLAKTDTTPSTSADRLSSFGEVASAGILPVPTTVR